jgi:hypothetical protein
LDLEDIKEVASNIELLLEDSTNASDLQRRIISYWIVATWGLKSFEHFPLLCLFGPTSTGKTTTLTIITEFAYHAKDHFHTLQNMTDAVLRDKLILAHERTCILEEADQGAREDSTAFEHWLSNRCSRKTAQADINRQPDERTEKWKVKSEKLFGPTVLHRRTLFSDAALDTRTILISYIPKSKDYFLPSDSDLESMPHMSNQIELPRPQINGVSGRLINTYGPVISVAQYLQDTSFIDILVKNHLIEEAESLKEAQQSEPTMLIMQSIIARIFKETNPVWDNIKFSTLNKDIRDEHDIEVRARQIGRIARGLGFETKLSHGVTALVPTRTSFIRAYFRLGGKDEAVDAWLDTLFKGREGREGRRGRVNSNASGRERRDRVGSILSLEEIELLYPSLPDKGKVH